MADPKHIRELIAAVIEDLEQKKAETTAKQLRELWMDKVSPDDPPAHL